MPEIEKANKIAELIRKPDSTETKIKQYLGYLESDIKFGRDTTNSHKDEVRRLYAIKKELDGLS